MMPLFNHDFYFYVKRCYHGGLISWFSGKFIIEIFLESRMAYYFAENINYYLLRQEVLEYQPEKLKKNFEEVMR